MAREPHLIRSSSSAARTRELGLRLGRLLTGGECIALVGELGAGKTAFASGVGEGLDVPEPLRSPSYLLCCEHRGRLPVLHLDAYFTARLESLLQDGLASRFAPPAVLLVEWADRIQEAWPADRLEIRLDCGAGEEDRTLTARALGPQSARLLQAWAEITPSP